MEAAHSSSARRVRAAAIVAFAERGYGATSTRDIAKRLGLSAAAMYPHYPSKESLLYEISKEGHLAAYAALAEGDIPALPPSQRLQSVVYAFARWQAENSSLARVLQYELRSLTGEHFDEIVEIRRQTTAVLAAVIDAGCASGEFVTDAAAGALLAISSLCVDVCRWFPSHTHDDPDEIARLYSGIALGIVRGPALSSPI